MAFIRGTAVTGFTFGLVNKSNGTAVTSGTTIAYITRDGGTQALLSDTPVHEGNGQWSVNISAAEMDGTLIGLLFTNSNAIPVQFTLKTLTPEEGAGAAGPAASTGESTLSYCYLDFRHEVGLYYGYGRSFYSPINGTITIASGVVTLVGGMAWPAEAADMRLFLSGGHYTVDSRDSDTQITLDDTTVNLASGSSFELHPWTDNDLTDIDTTIIRGLRQFYAPPILPGKKRAHNWSFLRQLQPLTTTAPYETGTVTIVDGVVTLDGGTWPSWAADGELTVGGVSYTVDERGSDSELTLDDTTVDIAAGTSYSLRRPQQDLPDSYGGWDGPLTYRPGTTGFYEPIEVMSEVQIREARMRSDTPNRPRRAFIRAKSSDGAGGQRWEIGWWPVPDDAYVLYGRMRVNPNRLTFLKPCPLGGLAHGETILESCLAIAESKLDDIAGLHHSRFMTLLAASIEQDMHHTPEFLGVNRDYSDRDGIVERRDINDGSLTQYTGHSLRYD